MVGSCADLETYQPPIFPAVLGWTPHSSRSFPLPSTASDYSVFASDSSPTSVRVSLRSLSNVLATTCQYEALKYATSMQVCCPCPQVARQRRFECSTGQLAPYVAFSSLTQVSFPVQMLGKSFKMMPVMLWGIVISFLGLLTRLHYGKICQLFKQASTIKRTPWSFEFCATFNVGTRWNKTATVELYLQSMRLNLT